MTDNRDLNQLLSSLSAHIAKVEIELASKTLMDLDHTLKAWCESSSPPTEKELLAIQVKIDEATKNLKSTRDKTQTELLNQRQSNKAISKYKATKL